MFKQSLIHKYVKYVLEHILGIKYVMANYSNKTNLQTDN